MAVIKIRLWFVLNPLIGGAGSIYPLEELRKTSYYPFLLKSEENEYNNIKS